MSTIILNAFTQNERINAARAYIESAYDKNGIDRSGLSRTMDEVTNDAANIYSVDYDDYCAICKALKSK